MYRELEVDFQKVFYFQSKFILFHVFFAGFRELQKQQAIQSNVPDLDELDSEQPPPYQNSPPPYEDDNTLMNGNSDSTGEKVFSL
jgi:hypothetical protein